MLSVSRSCSEFPNNYVFVVTAPFCMNSLSLTIFSALNFYLSALFLFRTFQAHCFLLLLYSHASFQLCSRNYKEFLYSSFLLLFTFLLQLLYAIQIVLFHATECFSFIFFVFCLCALSIAWLWLIEPFPIRRFSPVDVKIPSRCFAQSSIFIGISRSACLSVKSRYPETSYPIARSSFSFR